MAFVQQKTAAAAPSTPNVSVAITYTPGNFSLVALQIGNSSEQTANSVGDTVNLYTKIPASHVFNGLLFSGTAVEFWYAMNVQPSASPVTAAWTSAGGFANIYVNEYSGVVLTGALHAGNAVQGASQTPSASVVSSAGELIIAMITSPDTITFNNTTSRGTPGVMSDASAPGASFTANYTGTASNQFAIALASFKLPIGPSNNKRGPDDFGPSKIITHLTGGRITHTNIRNPRIV